MRKLLKIMLLLGLLAVFSAACNKTAAPAPVKKPPVVTTPSTPSTSSSDSLTYLALGDSYTIGQSVPLEQNFPNQLRSRLNETGHPMSGPSIIAATGWTTADLKAAIAARNLGEKRYDIVTLLIGVNNQYRGYSPNEYRVQFTDLLHTAINHAKGGKGYVFVLSIPDWGVTPYADGRDREQIAKEIDQFNAINKEETEKLGVAYVDITPSSRRAAQDAGLIAGDGLHPSERMYALWVQQLFPLVSAKVQLP